MNWILVITIAASLASTQSASVGKGHLIKERIVGGKLIDITEAPYQAALLENEDQFCGGVIISPNWILTAARCSSDKEIFVRVGSSNSEEGGTYLRVESFVQHPEFLLLDYDFALVQVNETLAFNERVQPVVLPQDGEETAEQTPCFVTGYGSTLIDTDPYAILRGVVVPIYNQAKCVQSHLGIITPRMICAAHEQGGKDACIGDGGGPLVCNNRLIGLVSWGEGCARAMYPAVYAKVSAVRSWIKEVTGV